jgi:hypothetical protein
MGDVHGSAQQDSHVPIVRLFFDQAIKLTRSGVFQLKKAATALGMDIEEKTVTLSGWLDFCHAHHVRRRFMIVEADLIDIFNMCKMSQQAASDRLNMDQFQQVLIMLGSKVGLHAQMPQHSAQQETFSHGNAFDSLLGVVSLLHEEFSRPPDPWKPLLIIIPKMKALFQKVAKNSKDPIGSLGKSGSLVSCREFLRFCEEQNLNQMFASETSNIKLMQIFKRSQITPNSEKSQCDIREFSYTIMLLAIELRALSPRNLEFYVDTAEGGHSIFDQCDPETGHILNSFVHKLLGLRHEGDEEKMMHNNIDKKQRRKGVSLTVDTRLRAEEKDDEYSASFQSLPSVNCDEFEPEDGSLSSKKIREIVSKGYIYRRSKTASYLADALDMSAGFDVNNKSQKSSIDDAEFNPILDLLEDDCIEVIPICSAKQILTHLQLAVEVEEHQKKEIIQCLRINAFKRHLALQIEGHDQSTSANSVASILEFVIQRAFDICDDVVVRKSLTSTMDRRWNIGQRCTICKVGVFHLSLAIIYELIDEAVEFSVENVRKEEELRLRQIHENGLIWNRTSPGWRYFRAMHVYEELYSQQTVPEIEAVNELHKATKDYYSDHIEKVIQSHKLRSSTKRSGQNVSPATLNSVMQTTPVSADYGKHGVDHGPEHVEPDSGLAIAWKLRQQIQQDCVYTVRTDPVVVEIDSSGFELMLSPHLSSALKESGKQKKDQNYLSAIKHQAKSINDAVIANYSVPSPTFLKRQKDRVNCSHYVCCLKHNLIKPQELQDLNDKVAAEAKESAARQALRSKQASEQAKSSKAETAMKLLEDQMKMDHIIREAKKVAESSKQLMEQKREEITEERMAVIRHAFECDSRAGKQVVCGFSGKMQRLPSSIDQFEAKMTLYASPVSSPKKQQLNGSPLSTRPSTPNSSQSFMSPKLWASVVSARCSPENSRPSTSQSTQSPSSLAISPIQSFTASVKKGQPRSPSLDRVSLFPGISPSTAGAYFK